MKDAAAPLPAPRALLRALFDAAVARAQPAHTLAPFLPPPPKGRTVLIGAGTLAQALDSVCTQRKARHVLVNAACTSHVLRRN